MTWSGLSWFPDWRLQSVYLVLYTKSIVRTVDREIVVWRITKVIYNIILPFMCHMILWLWQLWHHITLSPKINKNREELKQKNKVNLNNRKKNKFTVLKSNIILYSRFLLQKNRVLLPPISFYLSQVLFFKFSIILPIQYLFCRPS